MPLVEPTPIPAAPNPPDKSNRATFNALATAWAAYQKDDLQPGANALADNLYGNAVFALDKLTTDLATAAGYVSDASDFAGDAAASATSASGFADNAATSAASALAAPGTSATSTTSLTVGAGTKNLTIQTSKNFSVGQLVVIAVTASPTTNYMTGRILSYDSGTGALSVDATKFSGTGTFSAWTISLSAGDSTSGIGAVTYTGLSTTKALVASDMGCITLSSTQAIVATMPDATTLSGSRFAIIKNAGLFSIMLHDGAGNVLTHLAADESILLWADSIATAAGSWRSTNPSGGFVGDSATLAAINSYPVSCCYIDTGKLLVVYTNATRLQVNVAAVTINGDVLTVGTGVTLSTSPTNIPGGVCAKIGTDKAVVAYNYDTASGRARAFTVTGTTIGTPGTEFTFNAASSGSLSICQLNTDKAIACFRDDGNSSYTNARVLSVSGTTITAGAEFQVNAANQSFRGCSIAQLNTNKAMAVYYDDTATAIQARVLTVSGTTITGGTEVTVVTSSSAIVGSIRNIDTDTALIVYRITNSPSEYYLKMATAIGVTTITQGTAVLCVSSDTVELTGNSPALLSTTQGRLFFGVETGVFGEYELQVLSFSISGTSITVGALTDNDLPICAVDTYSPLQIETSVNSAMLLYRSADTNYSSSTQYYEGELG